MIVNIVNGKRRIYIKDVLEVEVDKLGLFDFYHKELGWIQFLEEPTRVYILNDIERVMGKFMVKPTKKKISKALNNIKIKL